MLWSSKSKTHREARKLAALDRSLAVIEFTPEGTIVSANENFCRVMGYSQGELVGKHHRMFVTPEYAHSQDYEAFWRKLSGGAFDRGAYTRLRKDGTPVYLQATYNPVLDSGGRVVSVLKVAEDITDAKKRMLELEAQATATRRTQAAVEFKPDGEIIDANDLFLATVGYRREQIVGRHHSMFVEPAYANSEAYRDFWRKLGSGQAVVDSFHRVGANGKKIWLQASYNPIFDLKGNVYKVVKFAFDISDLLLLADGLAQMSNGDLRRRIEQKFASAFDKLRIDYNQAAESLDAALRRVSEAADTSRASASEIATASQDLSRRTESQAASLEETSAALSEVTVTVKKTTESARQANQVVSAAKREAEQSGGVVGRAVGAMGRIEQSSQEIGKIIGVIDEIAFQTNLLALNAGVEAARAGDAGRGFAVVASEVRALAQRSAEAAKQIKTLIATSDADVDAGVRLVRETGEALGEIVAKVVELNGLVGDIAGAAEEQSSALAEVNVAVGQMDQSTQQNAAMAEEANAAVESMKQQIERLSEAVGGFKLAGAGEPARVGRGRRAA